jgi:predicted DNA binding CopG/RHH family protein
MNKEYNFNKEELEIIEAFETGNVESYERFESLKNRIILAAAIQQKNIQIKVNQNDLNIIISKAAEKGMNYKTLINSLIHKYASGVSDAKNKPVN